MAQQSSPRAWLSVTNNRGRTQSLEPKQRNKLESQRPLFSEGRGLGARMLTAVPSISWAPQPEWELLPRPYWAPWCTEGVARGRAELHTARSFLSSGLLLLYESLNVKKRREAHANANHREFINQQGNWEELRKYYNKIFKLINAPKTEKTKWKVGHGGKNSQQIQLRNATAFNVWVGVR